MIDPATIPPHTILSICANCDESWLYDTTTAREVGWDRELGDIFLDHLSDNPSCMEFVKTLVALASLKDVA